MKNIKLGILFLFFMFVATNTVKAYNQVIFNDVTNQSCKLTGELVDGKAVEECKLYLKVDSINSAPNYIDGKITLNNVEWSSEGIQIQDQNWEVKEISKDEKSGRYLFIYKGSGYENKTYTIATFKVYKINNEQECNVTFVNILPCTKDTNTTPPTYYDKNRKIATKEEYEESCSCHIDGNRYFDTDGNLLTSDGTKTAKEKYNDVCNISCKIVGDKYYDINGNMVSEDDYNKSCNSCLKINNIYYNKDGKKVTKEEYEKDCVKSCVIEDGKYYGKDGLITDKQTYEKYCPAKENSNTGAFLPAIMLLTTGSVVFLIYFILKNKHKFN